MTIVSSIRLAYSLYLASSIIAPLEVLDATAKFLSLVFVLPSRRPLDVCTHLAKSLILSIGFLVAVTILAVKAIQERIPNEPAAKVVKPNKKRQLANTNNGIQDHVISIEKQQQQKAAVQPTEYPIPQNNTDHNDKALTQSEAVAATINNKEEPAAIEPSIVEEEEEEKKTTNDISPVAIEESEEQEAPKKEKHEPLPVIAKEPEVKDEKEPVSLVTSPLSTTIEENSNDASDQNSLSTASPLLPITTTLTKDNESPSATTDDGPLSASVTETVVDDKEQYYSEIIKKGNNIMALSDNLQRIFDEPPTPSPDQAVRPFSNIQPSSIDETTTTPALTPPNQSSAAGSTLSRKSSTTSQHSSAFKSRLQTAMQKVSRVNSNEQDTLPNNKKNKRFSTMRLSRKKSINSIGQDQTDVTTESPDQPQIKPKKSVSTKFLKNTGKRFSKLFS